MDCSVPGFPVHQHLPKFAQIHVHWAVISSNHLILCCPLLLLPSIFPSIRDFLPMSWLFTIVTFILLSILFIIKTTFDTMKEIKTWKTFTPYFCPLQSVSHLSRLSPSFCHQAYASYGIVPILWKLSKLFLYKLKKKHSLDLLSRSLNLFCRTLGSLFHSRYRIGTSNVSDLTISFSVSGLPLWLSW